MYECLTVNIFLSWYVNSHGTKNFFFETVLHFISLLSNLASKKKEKLFPNVWHHYKLHITYLLQIDGQLDHRNLLLVQRSCYLSWVILLLRETVYNSWTAKSFNKRTVHKFIHLLAATFKDLHIENSKNYKRRYCPHHTDCVSMCCWIISPFVIFCCFRLLIFNRYTYNRI